MPPFDKPSILGLSRCGHRSFPGEGQGEMRRPLARRCRPSHGLSSDRQP